MALRDRLAERQAGDVAQPQCRWFNWLEMAFSTHLPKDIAMRPVLRGVDEASQVDCVNSGEMPQHMPGTDLVPLVRWIRDSMAEKQNFGHSLSDAASDRRPNDF